jgi:hypothetical protein
MISFLDLNSSLLQVPLWESTTVGHWSLLVAQIQPLKVTEFWYLITRYLGQRSPLDSGKIGQNLAGVGIRQWFAGIWLYYAKFWPVWSESGTNGQIAVKLTRIWSLLPDSNLHRRNSVEVSRILPASSGILSTVIFCRCYFFVRAECQNIFLEKLFFWKIISLKIF